MFIVCSTEFVGEPIEPPVQPVISEWKLDQVIDSFSSNNYAEPLAYLILLYFKYIVAFC